MKQKIAAAILAGALSLSMIGTVSATDIQPTKVQIGASRASGVVRAEETTWYYRVVDGKTQKRLWSNTEGKWLTDWAAA